MKHVYNTNNYKQPKTNLLKISALKFLVINETHAFSRDGEKNSS